MAIILAIVLIIGTAALVFWNVLMFVSGSEHEEEIARCTYRANKTKIALLYEKYQSDSAALENLDGLARSLRKMFHDPRSSEKKAESLQKSQDKLDAGNFGGINFLLLPGYGFLKMFGVTADNKFFSDTMGIYSELNGREFAAYETRRLLAAMSSCAIGGVGFSGILGVLMVASGKDQIGWILALGGMVGSVVAALSLHSGVKGKLKKRREEIMLNFPQAVSELALLTASGLEMFRAWNEVSEGRQGALFREMRQTMSELDNGFDPNTAFEAFVRRCGTKETTRLGASFLQNLKKDSSELSRFLIALSQDAWDERKHDARRLGEQAQSKLMLPMFLIFIGIIILVAAPVVMQMSQMGF